ncbi:MAG: Hpt domain-containing protein [Steroidobacteraceae bacterium]
MTASGCSCASRDEVLGELLGVFVNTLDDEVVSLLAAVTRAETAAVAAHAHAIRGAAANVAAAALARAAATLERMARDGVVVAIDVAALRAAWGDTQRHPVVEPFVAHDRRMG